MKRKEIQDLKQKPVAELRKLLKESQQKSISLMFDLRQGKLKNGMDVVKARKYIAILQTLIRASELASLTSGQEVKK